MARPWLMPRIPWDVDPETMKRFAPGVWQPDNDPVELYYLPDDFTPGRNIAAQHPEKVEELKDLFWAGGGEVRGAPAAGRAELLLRHAAAAPGADHIHLLRRCAEHRIRHDPRIYNHSYTISADLVIPEGGAEGVIVAEADHLGGFSLFVEDGKLKHTYSMLGVLSYRQESDEPAADRRGERANGVRRRRGQARHRRRGHAVRQRRAGRRGPDGPHVPFRFSGYAGMDIGRDNGPSSTAATRTGTVRVHRHRQEGRLRRQAAPRPTEDEQELHEHAQQALAGHAINA